MKDCCRIAVALLATCTLLPGRAAGSGEGFASLWPGAVAALTKLLKDVHPDVRSAAAKTLKTIQEN